MIGEWVTSRQRVRYAETDAMGHGNYASYLVWFEACRADWCRAHGFSYNEMEAAGFFLPVAEAYVRYRHEVKYDDVLEISGRLESYRRSRLKFEYELRVAGDPKVRAEGFTVHLVMGRSRTVEPLPSEIRAWMDRPVSDPFANGG